MSKAPLESSRRLAAPRILVVDDSDDQRALYAECLGFRGYEVAQASDGEEAVRAAFLQQPAIIVMDLDMPVMDGWTATRILKGDARTEGVPILVVTGNASPERLGALREAGCDGVLLKPCSPDALIAAIEHLLRGELLPARLCSA